MGIIINFKIIQNLVVVLSIFESERRAKLFAHNNKDCSMYKSESAHFRFLFDIKYKRG